MREGHPKTQVPQTGTWGTLRLLYCPETYLSDILASSFMSTFFKRTRATRPSPANPFKIGDRVVFAPDERAIGWSWSSFDRLRIHPGDEGVVTKILQDNYIYIDDDRGGFHWQCFKFAPPPQ
jgi:hypothetical protein